jgi:hypothetical protein
MIKKASPTVLTTSPPMMEKDASKKGYGICMLDAERDVIRMHPD